LPLCPLLPALGWVKQRQAPAGMLWSEEFYVYDVIM
jgi:hypothetical protein